jgi:hypothetical protein
VEVLDIIRRMQELLARERAAIARLDGVEVLSLAGEKMALARALESKPRAERESVGAQLKTLVRGLQNNGVLLSHARGILSDLLRGQGVTLRGSSVKTSTLRPLASSAARHLSVRG